MNTDTLCILGLALMIDLVFGDPPTRFHLVGWMGKLISILQLLAPKSGRLAPFAYGTFVVLFGITAFTAPVYFLMTYLEDFSRIVYIVAAALLLKSVFSVNGLYRSASHIKNCLADNNLAEAKIQMSALVSRSTSEMDEPSIVASTVESVAENTSDSFVAPMFWFLIFGIPGAVAYRMVNTFDSMIGYHGNHEYVGKFAARLDDVLNFIPARVTGMIIVIAAFISRKNSVSSWRIMIRDHSKTESPNAGWPMSAAAGALGVELEKAGHYKLGDQINQLSVHTIDSMLKLMCIVAGIWSLLCLSIEGVKYALTA